MLKGHGAYLLQVLQMACAWLPSKRTGYESPVLHSQLWAVPCFWNMHLRLHLRCMMYVNYLHSVELAKHLVCVSVALLCVAALASVSQFRASVFRACAAVLCRSMQLSTRTGPSKTGP